MSGNDDGTYQPAQIVTRDQMAVFIARALAGGEANVPAGPATPSFPNVPADYWAYRHVEFLKAQKVVLGYTNGTYGASDVVDRGQMAVFIARAVVNVGQRPDLPNYIPPTTPTFPDVLPDAWDYKFVEFLVEKSVVQGEADGQFHPELLCSRDQMAVFVARAFGL